MNHEEYIIFLDAAVKDIVGELKMLNKSDDLAWATIKSINKTLGLMSERIDILVKRVDKEVKNG